MSQIVARCHPLQHPPPAFGALFPRLAREARYRKDYAMPGARYPRRDCECVCPRLTVPPPGQVYAFGRESALGLGGSAATSASNPVAPKEVEGLTGCSQLALGNIHAMALFNSTADLGHFLN